MGSLSSRSEFDRSEKEADMGRKQVKTSACNQLKCNQPRQTRKIYTQQTVASDAIERLTAFSSNEGISMLDASQHSPIQEPCIAQEDEIDKQAEHESEIGLMDANITEFVR